MEKRHSKHTYFSSPQVLRYIEVTRRVKLKARKYN